LHLVWNRIYAYTGTMNLTERQEYELLAAISARGEIPVKFMYLGDGAMRWDAIYHDAEHSAGITNNEMALMMSHIKSFIQAFTDIAGINLIDLGCGNGLPAIDIIKAMQAQNISVNYVSVDLSKEMLELASKNIKQALPEIPITEIQADFESESLASQLLDIKRRSKQPNLLINLGNTLGNYINVSSVLTNFLQSMTLEDYLIVGNGLINDQNPKKILSAYEGVEVLREDLTAPGRELGLFTDEDSYQVLWNTSERRVEARIKLSENRQLSLAGQTVTMESGDEILVMRSSKYTEASLTKLLSNVGFRTELLTTNRNRSYILAMIQPTRYSAS
jgi:uncharacterized SAM-dependent methyltransferase